MSELKPRRRMAAAERRISIIDAATRCFAERGFAGTTTASVAARADVNEALVFRHVRSKRELYIACVDSAWQLVRERSEALIAVEPATIHWRMPGRAFLELLEETPHVSQLWMRGLVDATGIAEIDEHIVQQMHTVHSYITSLIVRSADAGGTLPGRDPEVEAWSVIAMGLLGASIGSRGLASPETFDAVITAHRTWLTGSAT